MKSKVKAFAAGFGYAAKGIWAALQSERNMRVHTCVGFYVLLFSFFYPFGAVEYALLFLCIGGVIALELVNSAIEQAVEQPDPAHWRAAGSAKDMAAGAVLVFSAAAAAVGIALFWQPKIIREIPKWFLHHPAILVVLLCSVLLSVHFIFNTKKKG